MSDIVQVAAENPIAAMFAVLAFGWGFCEVMRSVARRGGGDE